LDHFWGNFIIFKVLQGQDLHFHFQKPQPARTLGKNYARMLRELSDGGYNILDCKAGK
jgi:hypothetical protein